MLAQELDNCASPRHGRVIKAININTQQYQRSFRQLDALAGLDIHETLGSSHGVGLAERVLDIRDVRPEAQIHEHMGEHRDA
eukprot:2204955-Pyramimonas_sp.AAC.1